MQKKVYVMIANTPQGPLQAMIPEDGLRVCPCGSKLFHLLYKVSWAKNQEIVGSPAVAVVAQALACVDCNREPDIDDKCVADVEAEKVAGNGKALVG